MNGLRTRLWFESEARKLSGDRLARVLIGTLFGMAQRKDGSAGAEFIGELPDMRPLVSARHYAIICAMFAVQKRRLSLDPLTVAERLKADGALALGGGPGYLAQLDDPELYEWPIVVPVAELMRRGEIKRLFAPMVQFPQQFPSELLNEGFEVMTPAQFVESLREFLSTCDREPERELVLRIIDRFE